MKYVQYKTIFKWFLSAILAILVIIAFFYSMGWLASKANIKEPTYSCADYLKSTYVAGDVPVKCYEEYKVTK